MAVPYIFGTQTSTLSLSWLDSNFATPIVLGSTSLLLGSTYTSIAGLTLTGSAFNGTVGATTPSTGAFTTVAASGQITSTVSAGTAPFVVASTTLVNNLNANYLNGNSFASPGPIGSSVAS